MKSYRHYRPSSAWIALGILAMVAVSFLAVGIPLAMSDPASAPPRFVFLILIVPLGLNLWWLGSTALEIRTLDDGRVEFVAPFGTRSILISEILSIAPSNFSHGTYYVLKHQGGTLRFDPRLDGMHELISELVRQNPQIRLRGI